VLEFGSVGRFGARTHEIFLGKLQQTKSCLDVLGLDVLRSSRCMRPLRFLYTGAHSRRSLSLVFALPYPTRFSLVGDLL
jgi:hypothetical protein